MKTFLSTEVAHGLQIKHGKLVRDLDRVRSMLPPNFAAEAMILDTITNTRGIERRCYRLTAAALPFLFMGQATKTQVTWMLGVVAKW